MATTCGDMKTRSSFPAVILVYNSLVLHPLEIPHARQIRSYKSEVYGYWGCA